MRKNEANLGLLLTSTLCCMGETLSSHTRRFLMFVEVTFESKGFATASTYVWLVCRVCLNVRTQVGLVSERLVTLRATEGLLARVCTNMALEEPGSGEPLATIGTLTALIVCPYVHAVGRHGDVDLVTVRALTCFLV